MISSRTSFNNEALPGLRREARPDHANNLAREGAAWWQLLFREVRLNLLPAAKQNFNTPGALFRGGARAVSEAHSGGLDFEHPPCRPAQSHKPVCNQQ